MPFQSEKQRRFLHANHPEIAKRWEKEYAHGGISNHFRKKFFTGALADTQQGQAMSPGTSASGGLRHTPSGNGGGGDGPPSVVHVPTGPTLAEIAAAKAKAEAEKRRLEAEAKKKHVIDFKDRQKKKVKLRSKFDTPEWDTDLTTFSLEDFKSTKTLEDYYRQLDETDVPLSVFEKQHMEVLENQNKLGFEDEFKEKEGISNEKLMYPPPGNLAKVDKSQYNMLKALGQVGNTGGSADEIKELVPAGTFDSITDKEWDQIFSGKKFKEIKQGAKGGLARKNYFHGGILDINESEEIISDDGNDIELTAYNAAFDDPNDLSTGVKTLFQAKNGGMTIQGGVDNWLGEQETVSGVPIKWKSQPGAPETELAYITKAEKDLILKKDLHGSLKDGPNIGPSGVMSLDSAGGSYGSPGSGTGRDSPEGVGYAGHKDPVAPPAVRQKQIKDLIDKAEEEKYDSYEQMLQDKYPGQGVDAKELHYNKRKNEVILNKVRKDWEDIKKSMDEKYKKKAGKKLIEVALTGGLTLGLSDIIGVMIDGFKTNKAKNEFITEIKNTIANFTELGLPTHSPHTDTDIQKLNQELLDLTQTKDEDDDKGDDGPTLPQVVPVHEEIEEYEGTYAMSPWDRIKANQQKRAMLVEKGIIQENPIVDESVTDITMEANKGGLANLFRVKNQ